MRPYFAIVTATAMLAAGASLRAADAPNLPPSAVSEQTIAVGQFDVSSVSTDTLKATLKALLGDKASMFDEQMPDVEKMRTGFTTAGGKALAMIVNVGESGMPENEPIILVQPSAGADLSTLQSWLSEQAKGQVRAPAIAQRDGYLTLTQGPPDLPAASSTRYADLTGKLSKLPGEAKLVFVPTDAMRQAVAARLQAGMMPPQFAGLAQTLVNAKWMGLSSAAGEKASITLKMEMPDDTQAQQMAQLWSGLSAMAAQTVVGQYSRMGEEPPDMMQLMQAMAMKQEGAELTMSLDTPTLATISKAMAPAMIQARARAKRAVAASNMRQLSIGIITYAADNGDKLPDSLDQLQQYMGSEEAFKKLMTHPTTGTYPGFVYVKPAAKMGDVQNPSETVMIYEAGPDGKPNENGAKAYADGHVSMANTAHDAPATAPAPDATDDK